MLNIFSFFDLILTPKYKKILWYFWSLDIVFMILHILKKMTVLTSTKYSIEVDGSYGEIYQYIKAILIAVILAIIFIRRQKLMYFVWSAFFSYIFLDDWLQIHENLGGKIINYVPVKSILALRLQDLGELMIFALIGLVFLIGFAYSYYLVNKEDRSIFHQLLTILLLFIFFGVVFDAIHGMFSPLHVSFIGRMFLRLLTLIEDGGEMIVLSIFASFICQIFEQQSLNQAIEDYRL